MIGRVASLLGTLALAAPLALAQTSTWVPDKAHSSVDFSILHMSLSQVRGHFGNIGGSIVWNEGDITKSTVNVTIDVTTVDTGVAARDADLKSDHFFDVAKFPSATFVSTSVSKSGSGLTISGNLTLHGVTKPVVLQVDGPGVRSREWIRSSTPAFQQPRRSSEQTSALRQNTRRLWWATTLI